MINQKKHQDQIKIKNYRDLVTKLLDTRDNLIFDLNALKLTETVLQLNPELNTAWNYRRDIITQLGDKLKTEFWENELQFIMLQLKRFPKVYWIWNHRVWVLDNYASPTDTIWRRELMIVDKLLAMDARNYHGWHYRRIVVGKIEVMTKKSLDKQELTYVTSIINKNISNFSAWHQRVQLMTHIFKEHEVKGEEMKKMVIDEIEYITNAVFTDADDQSVWFYIKWFMKNDIVSNTLNHEEYVKMLQDLKKNILMINDDDIEFSGKENNWCLKTLVVIEKVLKSIDVHDEDNSTDYIEKLMKNDPDRKNRYKYLLSK